MGKAVFPTARWVKYLGTCRCGKQATGELMDVRNDRLTVVCTRCANVLLKAAQRDRDNELKLHGGKII